MDIVIISEFCDSFSRSDNDRFLYLANMLARDANNNVELITSSFQHTTKSQRKEPEAQWPFTITFIDEPGYPKNICVKRFQSHHNWGRSVYAYIKKRKKPDAIYCAIPSLTGPNLVSDYCKKAGIRFVIDVQDLWPEAFRMAVDIPIISDIAFVPFYALADGTYKRADAICAVSESYCNRAVKVNKKCIKGKAVFIGTELDTFDTFARKKPLIEKDPEKIWIGYAGTLGTSYDLPLVFDALRIINNPNIEFIVMGDGPLRERFEIQAKNTCTTFTGRLPYDQMCSLLNECDMVVNPIIGSSVATIINKHADYAASGKPVINTQQSDEYIKLIDQYQMGLNCSNEDPTEMANCIRLLAQDEALRKTMGRNARLCAEKLFDRKISYQQLVDAITQR